MADSSDSRSSVATESEEAVARQELDDMKRDLEGWREALVPLRGLLMWEQPHHPAVLFLIITVIFALIWFFEPSVLTTFGLLGLTFIGIDFIVPYVSPYLFSTTQWTGREEHQFEEICERILHFRTHMSHFLQGCGRLKTERPKVYLLVLFGLLTFFAWLGSVMDNLFLTYFIILTIVMIPGLRRTGIAKEYMHKYWIIFKRMLFGRLEQVKRKIN